MTPALLPSWHPPPSALCSTPVEGGGVSCVPASCNNITCLLENGLSCTVFPLLEIAICLWNVSSNGISLLEGGKKRGDSLAGSWSVPRWGHQLPAPSDKSPELSGSSTQPVHTHTRSRDHSSAWEWYIHTLTSSYLPRWEQRMARLVNCFATSGCMAPSSCEVHQQQEYIVSHSIPPTLM